MPSCLPPASAKAFPPLIIPFAEVFTGCNMKFLAPLNPALTPSFNPIFVTFLPANFAAPSLVKDSFTVATPPFLATLSATLAVTLLAYLEPFLTIYLVAVLAAIANGVVVPFPLSTGLPFSS